MSDTTDTNGIPAPQTFDMSAVSYAVELSLIIVDSLTAINLFGKNLQELFTGPLQAAMGAAPPTVGGTPESGTSLDLGQDSANVALSGFGSIVTGGDGTDYVQGGLGDSTVTLGNGNDSVSLGGLANVVALGNGNDSVNAGLGMATVAVGNGDDSIVAEGQGNRITVGRGLDQIVAGSGNDEVQGVGGNDTITLGGSGNLVSMIGTQTTLTDAAGRDTIVLTDSTANLTLYGSGDMVFLNGSTAAIDDHAQGLDLTIGGAVNGTDAIENAANDPSLLIDLTGGVGGYATTAAVLAALTSDGHGGTMLALGAHGTIDFLGLGQSHLTAANFHIG